MNTAHATTDSNKKVDSKALRMRALLGSGGFSTPARQAHWVQCIDAFLGPVQDVLFVPFALADHDAYVTKMVGRGFNAGRKLHGIHRAADLRRAVHEAKAIYVGGGNSFRLLYALYQHNLLDVIRERVHSGDLLYVGVSAGTNMACPTLKTTNDMPIVMPPSFESLGLISFQINPHYFSGAIHYATDAGLIPYGGETRDDRIREFHEMNAAPVLGLCEGAVLHVENSKLTLSGEPGNPGARLFRKGLPHEDIVAGADLIKFIST